MALNLQYEDVNVGQGDPSRRSKRRFSGADRRIEQVERRLGDKRQDTILVSQAPWISDPRSGVEVAEEVAILEVNVMDLVRLMARKWDLSEIEAQIVAEKLGDRESRSSRSTIVRCPARRSG